MKSKLPNSLWYVVQCRPHQEARAKVNLERQGFETLLPTYLATSRRGQRFAHRETPLFPGYLFVRFAVDRDRWRSIFGTFGVTRLICAGDTPLAVPSSFMDDLVQGSPFGRDALAPGEDVRIVRGPFSGLTARLMHLGPAGRVRVLVSILGGAVPLEVTSDVLVPAA